MSTTTESVTGERVSSAGLKTDRPSFEPIPAGDYELTVGTSSIQERSATNANSIAYVKTKLTTEVEGKKRVIFANFFLKNTPAANGKVIWKNSNGLLGFAKALGDDFDVATTTLETTGGEQVSALSPMEVKEWLNGKEGMTVRAHVKVREPDAEGQAKGYKAQNEISYYIANEA
jgi:hypothetical protein